MTPQEANRQLVADLKVVVHDAQELLKVTTGETGEKFKELRGRLAREVESVKVTCQRLQDRTVESAKATDHIIREHPYESIGIAFGAGLLIGVLISPR